LYLQPSIRLKATLLKILTNVKPIQFKRESLRSILIFRYDRIGDMVVSLPLCKALKNGFPRAKIAMISSDSNACIADACTHVDETIIKPTGIFKWLITLIRLRKQNYDLAIDLNHAVTPHTIFAIRLISPIHVASPFKDGRWGVDGTNLPLFNLMPPQHHLKYARPIAETYLDIARLLDCPTDGCIPYPLPDYERPTNSADDYIILNPSGSRVGMNLEHKDLEEIIRYIGGLNSSIKIVIPAMPKDYEALSQSLRDYETVMILAPSSSIKPILPLVQFAKLVITPDTALVHIACAYNVPLIAVYTSSQALYAQWQPYPRGRSFTIRSSESKTLSGYSLPELLSYLDKLIGKPRHTNLMVGPEAGEYKAK